MTQATPSDPNHEKWKLLCVVGIAAIIGLLCVLNANQVDSSEGFDRHARSILRSLERNVIELSPKGARRTHKRFAVLSKGTEQIEKCMTRPCTAKLTFVLFLQDFWHDLDHPSFVSGEKLSEPSSKRCELLFILANGRWELTSAVWMNVETLPESAELEDYEEDLVPQKFRDAGSIGKLKAGKPDNGSKEAHDNESEPIPTYLLDMLQLDEAA
jgi:hypothetical protein